jgi:hypothetical protein
VVLIQHEEKDSPLAHGGEGWQLADGLLTTAKDLRVRKPPRIRSTRPSWANCCPAKTSSA